MARFIINGYGQIELNNVAWPRDGRVEAQSKVNGTDFEHGLENGMLVSVDGAAREIVAYSADLPWAVVYSTEKSYDPTKSGLKNFKNEVEGFLPRVGYPSVGDKWTTNCFAADASAADGSTPAGLFYKATDMDQADMVAAIDAAFATATATDLYAVPDAGGAMVVSATAAATGPLLKVLKRYTMPDGSPAIQVQVIRV